MIHSQRRPRTWQDLLGEDTSSHTFCVAWIHPFIPHFPRIPEGQNTVSAVSAGDRKLLPQCHESVDREKRLRGEEQSRCINSGLASGKQGPLLPSWRGAESWNKFEPGSGIHTKFITRSGLSLF